MGVETLTCQRLEQGNLGSVPAIQLRLHQMSRRARQRVFVLLLFSGDIVILPRRTCFVVCHDVLPLIFASQICNRACVSHFLPADVLMGRQVATPSIVVTTSRPPRRNIAPSSVSSLCYSIILSCLSSLHMFGAYA